MTQTIRARSQPWKRPECDAELERSRELAARDRRALEENEPEPRAQPNPPERT
jgi:hypothetical protein